MRDAVEEHHDEPSGKREFTREPSSLVLLQHAQHGACEVPQWPNQPNRQDQAAPVAVVHDRGRTAWATFQIVGQNLRAKARPPASFRIQTMKRARHARELAERE
jgi:hypothetical protein